MKKKEFCPYCQHILSTKFIEDRQRLYCPQCRIPIYENPIPATAAVYFNKNREILLVMRKVDPKKGEWCLPGGFVEIEETPEQCCLRELKEETNLRGVISKLMGVYLSDSPVYKSVLVIGYLMRDVEGEIAAGDDAEEVCFFPIDRLPMIAFESHRSLIHDGIRLFENLRPAPVVNESPIHFGAYVITSNSHSQVAENACRGGARIVQYRDKDPDKKSVLARAMEIRAITRKNNSLFVVNDYIDIACLVLADGVHLGQDDLPIKEARTILPGHSIIGVSTHSLEQALRGQADGADYIAIGPVFPTPTKENYSPVGLETVKKVIKAVSVPVVAIGGITLDHVSELKEAGVENVAMVREFQHNTSQVVKEINRRLGLR